MAIKRYSAQSVASSKRWGRVPLDAYWSSVVALLHGDGSNGSTTITDSSSLASNWTASNVTVSTTQSKFGGASLYFNNGYVAASAASSNFAFGTGDWTVEMWVYPTSLGTSILYDGRPSSLQNTQPTIYLGSGTPALYVNGDDVIAAGSALSANTWTHLAVSRVSGTTRMFVNGTQTGSSYSDSTNYTNTTSRPVLGADGFSGGNYFAGYLDDVRVTKAGRHSANFTIPTSAYPDSA